MAGPKSRAPSRLFTTAVKDVAKPWKPRLRHQAPAPKIPPTEATSTAVTPEQAPHTSEVQPVEEASKTSLTPERTWTACPGTACRCALESRKFWTLLPRGYRGRPARVNKRQEDITVCTDMGRISPFSVGYACTEIGDKQPEGRAANILLSRVWQQVKVNSDADTCYLGHEFAMLVFRARAVDGREQLFTTEPWKLYCLQRAAAAPEANNPASVHCGGCGDSESEFR